jgi:hypothetical protein
MNAGYLTIQLDKREGFRGGGKMSSTVHTLAICLRGKFEKQALYPIVY